jgi:hypothetical protein
MDDLGVDDSKIKKEGVWLLTSITITVKGCLHANGADFGQCSILFPCENAWSHASS